MGRPSKPTKRQIDFAKAYIVTGNAKEAYKQSYDASGMKDTTLGTEAVRTSNHPNVVALIEKAQQKQIQQVDRTLDSHLTKLEDLRDAAEADGEYSAAISAEVSRGKCLGFYTEKVEVKTTKEHKLVLEIAQVSEDAMLAELRMLNEKLEQERAAEKLTSG